MDNPDELKSRFQELYPPFLCEDCDMEHSDIPRIFIMQRPGKGQEPVKTPLLPFEALGLAEGLIRPGRQDQRPGSGAYVYGLLYGIPGGQPPITASLIYMN